MSIIRQLRQWLLDRIWYAHPPQVVLVRATPAECIQTLATATKPSTARLHLRNLFAEGRRYYFQPDEAGFRMKSTTPVPWRRRRSRSASVLHGTCDELTEGVTHVEMQVRMTAAFFLDVFLLPTWMSLLLITGPLSLPVGIGASLLILVLSWIWHRYTAMIQALDMIYFVQVALNDLPEYIPEQLPQSADDNVIYADFEQQWRKFYEDQSGEG